MSWEKGAHGVSWDCSPRPEGEWLITVYDLVPRVAETRGTVDLMSRDASPTLSRSTTRSSTSVTGEYFGNAMRADVCRSRGLLWGQTPLERPAYFETFQRKAGYDLIPHLPGLTYDIGP